MHDRAEPFLQMPSDMPFRENLRATKYASRYRVEIAAPVTWITRRQSIVRRRCHSCMVASTIMQQAGTNAAVAMRTMHPPRSRESSHARGNDELRIWL
jgi:hypothetical protein